MLRSSTFFTLASVLLLSACGSNPIQRQDNPQYWQKVSVSDAAYIRGPKAQQMLSRDISRCVVELRELESLGSIRNAIPADRSGRIYDPGDSRLNINEWDTPERDGALLAEHTDYVDFYGCMLANGWERVVSLTHERVTLSNKDYVSSNLNYRAKDSRNRSANGAFDNLNE